MAIKKINRNAFNEKLIHRYLFETYYFWTKSERNKLLPSKFHKKDINLIVPEESKWESWYRADLTIYFKWEDVGIPVEVKWSSKDLTKPNQVDYIKNNDWFLIAFNSGWYKESGDIDCINIDYNNFSVWLSNNISKLTRETLMYQAKLDEASAGNQFWVVFLRGTAHANFEKMKNMSNTNSFWAFKQNSKALKNIFDMQKWDLCLFVLWTANEGMGMSDNANLSCWISGYYIAEIKEPYYMVLDWDKWTFFEEGDIPVNKRRRPHFMDFKITDGKDFSEMKNFWKRGDYSKPFADSYNYGGGTPAPLLRRERDSLVDRLKLL